MRAIKKLSRRLASALFTRALGEAFDWVPSVPAGARLRCSPPLPASGDEPAPVVNAWSQPEGLKPSAS